MERYFELFNRLGLREKLGLVFGLALVIYLLLDFGLIGPEQKRQKALRADFARIEAETIAARADMVVVKAQLEKDPFAKDRAQLDAFKKAIDDADAFLSKVESDPRQVGILLRQMIAASPGLTLVSLKTLPAVAVVESKAAPGAEGSRSVYRRGIEVIIKGNYLAMLPYLEKLQNQPTRLLWGEAELQVVGYPDSTLKVLLYTINNQPEVPLG